MEHKRIHIVVSSKNRTLRADYTPFGPYVELTFGHTGYQPTEVINVWDYEANESDVARMIENVPALSVNGAVRLIVQDWIKDQDKEWPEWYEGYLENARYS